DKISTADKKTASTPIKFQKNSTLHNHVIETLIEIWRNVLGVKEIGLDDDFATLGGHSLLAIRLLAKIHKQLGIKISLAALLEAR
ncbi:phosphopantetheine-binding protein, partial [Acinetobacter baumannii]